VETIYKLGKPLGVIINRHGIGNNDVESYCAYNQIPVLAKIPFDRQIAECYSKGELVYDKVEHVETSLRQIIKYLDETHRNHV